MNQIYLFIVLALSLICIQCNYRVENCSLRKVHFGSQEYQAKGCLIDGLESGEWYFYSSRNELIEKGFYDRGIRIGEWNYPKNKSDSLIVWEKYENKNLKFLFNIPVLLDVVEDSSNYVKFSNKDSSNLFNVVVTMHSGVDLETFYKIGETEIKTYGWNFSRIGHRILTENRTLYLHDYTINKSAHDSFKVLNLYGLMGKEKLFEITCRYSPNIEVSAKTIFFSLVTNIFYNNERFINVFEKIRSMTVE